VIDPVLEDGLSAVMERIGARIRRDLTWPTPAAGLASWAFNQVGAPTFFKRPPENIDGVLAGRLGEGPVLACCGYLLAHPAAPGTETALAESWVQGIDLLSSRQSLPSDRQSFFFRPVELLGIALGAAAVEAQHPQPSRWLRHLIEQGSDRLGTTPWHRTLETFARAELHCTPRGRFNLSEEMTASEIAGLWLLAGTRPETAADTGVNESCEQIETRILRQVLLSETAELDVAEAAVLHCAISAAVNKRLPHEDPTPENALNTLVQIMRRFPKIVRELSNRQRSRPNLVRIHDEYDVQDLLRGILRGLFDDVRLEEWTPSRAGATSRIDLMLKREGIFIETKMTRPSLNQRKVAEQLILDKELYRGHPDCKMLLCFVYDPTHRLDNPESLERDLTEMGGPLPTVVIVSPHD
jgi:hypothetical protein